MHICRHTDIQNSKKTNYSTCTVIGFCIRLQMQDELQNSNALLIFIINFIYFLFFLYSPPLFLILFPGNTFPLSQPEAGRRGKKKKKNVRGLSVDGVESIQCKRL